MVSLKPEGSQSHHGHQFLIPSAALNKRQYPETSQEALLLVIPESYRSEVLHKIHDSPEGGHNIQRSALRKTMGKY